jgi:PKD repeat protein
MSITLTKTSLAVVIAVGLVGCNENNDPIVEPAKPLISQIISPSTIVVGQLASFVVKGQNLTSNNVSISSSDCTNLTISTHTASQINFACMPTLQGTQNVIVKNSAGVTLLTQNVAVACPVGQLANNHQCFTPLPAWVIQPSSGFLLNAAYCGDCVVGTNSYSYNWGDGTPTQSGTWQKQHHISNSHTYATAGTYTVKLTLIDAINSQASQQKTVIVSAKGVISVLPTPAMAGDSISFLVTNVLDDIKSVVWTIGSSITSVIKAIGEALTSVFSAGEQAVQAELKDSQGRTVNTLHSTLAVQALCGLGQVAQNYVCIDVPLTVTSVSPNTLTQNQKTKITLVGTNLPATAMFTLQNSVCEAPIEQSATSISQYKSDVEAGKVTFAVTVNPVVLATGLLNDTGITQCANDTTVFSDCSAANLGGWFGLNQDGQTGRDVLAGAGQLTKVGGGDAGFDFTKISATGQKLPANALAWSCVLDNHTGLMWEVKTNDGGLHDTTKTYTWYNSDATTNGGFEGYVNDGNNTQAFTKAVNAQGLCGYTDWYVPDHDELKSLVNYGKFNPSIDTNFFPNTQSNWYWSSSPVASGGGDAWGVDFGGGGGGGDAKANSFFVRLVRASQ